MTKNSSDKNRWIAFVLAVFFGYLGFHRFYVGKIGTGFLYLFTLGFFGIGTLVDCIMLLIGSSTDKSGQFLNN